MLLNKSSLAVGGHPSRMTKDEMKDKERGQEEAGEVVEVEEPGEKSVVLEEEGNKEEEGVK